MLKTNSGNRYLLTKNSLILHPYIIFKLTQQQKFIRRGSQLKDKGLTWTIFDMGTVLKGTQMIQEFESDF